jgi:hypothetical protein
MSKTPSQREIFNSLHVGNAASFNDSSMFRCWLWFEETVLLPQMPGHESEDDHKYSNEKAFNDFMIACGDAEVPPFVRKGRKAAMFKFKTWCDHFWKSSLSKDLPFRLRSYGDKGIGVQSLVNNWGEVTDQLVGWQLPIISEKIYEQLKKLGYNSLFENSRIGYIVFGPLQYVNHECGKPVSLILHNWGIMDSHSKRRENILAIGGFMFRPYTGAKPKIKVGEEYLCCYNSDKKKPDDVEVLGLIAGNCLCAKCANTCRRKREREGEDK